MIFSLHKIVVFFGRVPRPEVLRVLQPAHSAGQISGATSGAGRKPREKWAKRLRGLALPRIR